MFVKIKNFINSLILALILFVAHGASTSYALTISSFAEIISTPNVGSGGASVSFENTYSNPVAVCTYVLASAANEPGIARINSISGSGMTIQVLEMPNSTAVTAGTVQCLIVEEGLHSFEDGTAIEARTATITSTNGNAADDGWSLASTTDMSSSFTGSFTSPIALVQIMSSNDSDASAPWVTNCTGRGTPAFSGSAPDDICVGKHIGRQSGGTANETAGVIVIDQATGINDDVEFRAVRGADSGAGVGNNPPYSYGLGDTYEFGVMTQAAEDGGDGGWVVMYGANPVSSTINWAIEEEDAAGDTSRRHTHENVDYFVVRKVPDFEIAKTVDFPNIGEPTLLSYTITLENTGRWFDLTGVSVTDILPDSSTGTLSGPTESDPGGTAGVLDIGETWEYSVTYSATAADITAGVDLINNVSATTSEYTSEGIPDESNTATTTIVPPVPGLSILKEADPKLNVAVGQVVNYTFTVTNTGNITIDNVSISDVHNGSGGAITPDDEALLTDNGVSGDSIDTTANDGIWSQLGPGDIITFEGSYTITQSDVDTL